MLREKYRLDEEKWNRQNTKPTEAEDVTGRGGEVPPGMVETGSVDMLKLLQEIDDEDDDAEIVEEPDSESLPKDEGDV